MRAQARATRKEAPMVTRSPTFTPETARHFERFSITNAVAWPGSTAGATGARALIPAARCSIPGRGSGGRSAAGPRRCSCSGSIWAMWSPTRSARPAGPTSRVIAVLRALDRADGRTKGPEWRDALQRIAGSQGCDR